MATESVDATGSVQGGNGKEMMMELLLLIVASVSLALAVDLRRSGWFGFYLQPSRNRPGWAGVRQD